MVLGLDSVRVLDVEILHPLLHAPPFHSQEKKKCSGVQNKEKKKHILQMLFFFSSSSIGSVLNLWYSKFGERRSFAKSYISEATHPSSLAFSPELVFSFPCSWSPLAEINLTALRNADLV